MNSNLFSVQICFWEYISRKVFEFENVYHWYIKNENFHRSKSVLITFSDNSTEIIQQPVFIRTKVIYRLQTPDEKIEEKKHMSQILESTIHDNNKIVSRLISLFDKQLFRVGRYNRNVKILINGKDINSPEYIESTYPRQKIDYNAKFTIARSFLISDKQKCRFRISIINNGDSVIEDYKLYFSIKLFSRVFQIS